MWMDRICFLAAAEWENYFYFSAWLFNGLFRMNYQTNEIMYIGRVKEESRETCLHGHAIAYANRIYFIPAFGKCIAKLNLNNLSIETIRIPESSHCCRTEMFSEVIVIKDELWLIPSGYDALVKMDLKTEILERYSNWPEHIKWKKETSLLFNAGIHISSVICMCPNESQYFVTFDLVTKEMKKWRHNFPEQAFCKMIYHGGYVWLLPKKDYPYIVKYSPKTQEQCLLATGETAEKGIEALHYTGGVIGNKILLPPYQTTYWLIVDTQTDIVEKINIKSFCDSINLSYPMYQAVNYICNGMVATSDKANLGQYVSGDDYNFINWEIQMNDTVKGSYLASLMDDEDYRVLKGSHKCSLYQEKKFGLNTYIDAILQLNKEKSYSQIQSCGKKIFIEVKKDNGEKGK